MLPSAQLGLKVSLSMVIWPLVDRASPMRITFLDASEKPQSPKPTPQFI